MGSKPVEDKDLGWEQLWEDQREWRASYAPEGAVLTAGEDCGIHYQGGGAIRREPTIYVPTKQPVGWEQLWEDQRLYHMLSGDGGAT